MTVKESLKPLATQRVMDLVAEAGVNVERWANSSRGPVRIPAANPAHCYEWAFIEQDHIVVLNVWHREIQEDNGTVWCNLNLRAWADEAKRTEFLSPGERSAIRKRAIRMDEAIAYASKGALPVRLIIGEGLPRDISDPKSKTARMNFRLLDPEPWHVQHYSEQTGECRLSRGAVRRYADQYTRSEISAPKYIDVNSRAWERDRKVRDAALIRARGCCELCRQPGFLMVNGEIYLETHHVVPLSENGPDHECNVVALCPTHHREAHYGERRKAIQTQLLTMLAEIFCTSARESSEAWS